MTNQRRYFIKGWVTGVSMMLIAMGVAQMLTP